MRNFSPQRALSYLGTTFGCLVFVYLAIVVTTVVLASEQTRLTASIADSEASIGTLETQYYTAIDSIDAMDPSMLGLVTPKDTVYAHAMTVSVALTNVGD